MWVVLPVTGAATVKVANFVASWLPARSTEYQEIVCEADPDAGAAIEIDVPRVSMPLNRRIRESQPASRADPGSTCQARAGATGNVTVNVEPCPTVLVAEMVPPCTVMMA